MNYQRIYDSIVQRAKTRNLEEYCEVHHIIPRCLGGSNETENLVRLTPEEHYLAHQLLVKIHPESDSLVRAAAMMVANRPSNKLYGWLRRKFAKAQSLAQAGQNNSQYGTRWITDGEEDRKVSSVDSIPEGWETGRKSRVLRRRKAEQKRIEKQLARDKKVQQLRVLHEVYLQGGFEAVKRFGYDKSHANLVMRFADYLPEFVPQIRKKRGSSFN